MLKNDMDYEYGIIPTYNGPTPQKSSDDQYTYTFSHWSPEIKEVSADATYTVEFSSALNKYSVT